MSEDEIKISAYLISLNEGQHLDEVLYSLN